VSRREAEPRRQCVPRQSLGTREGNEAELKCQVDLPSGPWLWGDIHFGEWSIENVCLLNLSFTTACQDDSGGHLAGQRHFGLAVVALATVVALD